MHPVDPLKKPTDLYAALRKPIVVTVKDRVPSARATRPHKNKKAYVRENQAPEVEIS